MAAKVISQHDVKKILKMLSTNLVSSRISYVLSLLTISGNDFSDQVTIGLKLVFNQINWLHMVQVSAILPYFQHSIDDCSRWRPKQVVNKTNQIINK